MAYRSRAKRGPTDRGMKLARSISRWMPSGSRMSISQKRYWRRQMLMQALEREGLSWHDRYERILDDQADRENRRSDHARYYRAYGSSRDRRSRSRRRTRRSSRRRSYR